MLKLLTYLSKYIVDKNNEAYTDPLVSYSYMNNLVRTYQWNALNILFNS